MGLFGDTLRDARRPLTGTWVRRSADASPEPDIAPDEMPDTGMQTVFRFQKGAAPGINPSAAHEASPGPAAGKPVVPAADPLSVAAEVGTPEPSATNVIGYEGISDFLEVSRTSELETGQVRHGSPSKMAAANAKSESGASRSEVLSGRLETESYREPHKSNIPEGSERLVSEIGETSGSRPAGRGASPSETRFSPPAETPPAGTLTRATAHPSPREGEGLSSPPSINGNSTRPTANVAHKRPLIAHPSPFEVERPGERGTVQPGQATAHTNAIPDPARHGQSPSASTTTSWAPPSPRPHPREPTPPSLVIGRIDVVVVADAPARPQPVARPDTGYLSRHYLKRL